MFGACLGVDLQERKGARVVLVLFASGRQGGAVVEALLKAGPNVYEVWGTTRYPRNKRALEAQGVKVVQGDATDPVFLRTALKKTGAEVLFFHTLPGMEELQQGKAVVEVTKAAGTLKHVVYSSHADGASLAPRVQHVRMKRGVEELLQQSRPDGSWTILRPVMFIEHVFRSELRRGLLSPRYRVQTLASPTTAVKFCAVRDVGRAAEAVISNPTAWSSKKVVCVSFVATGAEIAAAMSSVTGSVYYYSQVNVGVLRCCVEPQARAMLEYLESGACTADPARFLAIVPSPTTLEESIRSRKDYRPSE